VCVYRRVWAGAQQRGQAEAQLLLCVLRDMCVCLCTGVGVCVCARVLVSIFVHKICMCMYADWSQRCSAGKGKMLL